MDDMFSSYDEPYTNPKVVKELIETMALESANDEREREKNMLQILENIKQTIHSEIISIKEEDYNSISGDEMIEMAVKEHQENISFIEDIMEENFKSSSK